MLATNQIGQMETAAGAAYAEYPPDDVKAAKAWLQWGYPPDAPSANFKEIVTRLARSAMRRRKVS